MLLAYVKGCGAILKSKSTLNMGLRCLARAVRKELTPFLTRVDLFGRTLSLERESLCGCLDWGAS